jgi:chemotaxis family two-component system sensor kinase Cph1
MQRLIGQVLDMSRIDGGLGLGLVLGLVDLAALVDDLVDEMRLAYPGIDYSFRSPGPTLVRADSGRISQVISNLLSNARHHGRVGGPIDVALSVHAGWATVELRNEGTPIPDEQVPTLFNPFKRNALHNPRNRTGMGLGLYIVATIVREHEGEISYRHEDGHVIFSVKLPLAETERAGAT